MHLTALQECGVRQLSHRVSSLCPQGGMNCSLPPSPTARFPSRMASCWPRASTCTGAALTARESAPSSTGCGDSLLLPGFTHSVHMHTRVYPYFSLFFFSLLSLCVILRSSRQPKQVHMTISKPLGFFFFFFVLRRVSHSIVSARLKLVTILLLQPPVCWDYRCEPGFQR
jgi:hypothetical protein